MAYKAIVNKINKDEDGTIVDIEVSYTNGTDTVEKTYLYTDYKFQTKDDFLNLFISEAETLEAKAAIVVIAESLKGDDEIIEKYKQEIEAKKSAQAEEEIIP